MAITLEVRPAGAGALVTLQEHAANPLVRATVGPLGDLAISLRNRVALRRLRRLSETGGDTHGTDEFIARQAWLYVAIVTAGYLISRGLAKSGVREPYFGDGTNDDRGGRDDR